MDFTYPMHVDFEGIEEVEAKLSRMSELIAEMKVIAKELSDFEISASVSLQNDEK